MALSRRSEASLLEPGVASVNAVQSWIDGTILPLAAEQVPLGDARNRVLAVDCRADMPIPDRNRAALDGFAVQARESVGAAAYHPHSVPAVAVAAGDPMPAGTDATVPLSFAEPDGHGGVLLLEAVVPGANVEPAGVVARVGDVLARGGTRLAPRHIGLLAAAGIAEVAVVRRPRVAILLAGPRRSQGIEDSNGPMIGAAVMRDGGVVANLVEAARDRRSLTRAIAGVNADLLLISGGTGPGTDDHAAAALSETGTLAFHGVALRPGETAGLGRSHSGIPTILLPGAPAACLCSYEVFAGRAVRRLAARDPDLPFRRRRMTLTRKIVSGIGLTEICPVRFGMTTETMEPLPAFAEIGLMAAVGGDGFVIVPEAAEGYPEGAAVTVHLYESEERETQAPQ